MINQKGWVFLCFFFVQNTYFGWNAKPMSASEVLADGITFLLLALVAIA